MKPKGYVPLVWPTDSRLTERERRLVDAQRRDLWRNGVRTEPMLTRMAFEFGAVAAMLGKGKP